MFDTDSKLLKFVHCTASFSSLLLSSSMGAFVFNTGLFMSLSSYAHFQDILLRDQGSASGGFSKSQKEIVKQHISHRLRFSLRVGFSNYS
jgi:hypothetical protein